MKIDVVYKLGLNPDWGNYEELRYSLRSLCNFENLGNVFIVGQKPDWIQEVIHIPALDPYKRNKDANLINKLILACSNPLLSERFINMSDDMFFLKKTNLNDLQIPLVDNFHLDFEKPQLNKWQTRLKRTIEVLKDRGIKNPNCFEAHTPYLLYKAYIDILMQFDYGNDIGYCGNTLFFNTIKSDFRYCTKSDLIRLDKPYSLQQLQQSEARYMNITNRGLNQDVKTFLQNKFNAPCKYEIQETF
jgi:hypothetical protein